MTDPAVLLQRYDEQLRTDAETQTAIDVVHLGPLLLATLAGGRGFITYRDLGGAGAAEIRELVPQALTHYRDDAAISRVEWKTRGHDDTPGLEDALLDNGFRREETESILIGEVAVLAGEVELPAGVTVRRITAEDEIRAMNAMQAEVFDDQDWTPDAPLPDSGIEYWVAEAAGQIVSAGRLEPVPGTDFAGLWGGATRPGWRGHGIYRALTAARARSALAAGITLVNVDCTEFSRPILERAGLVRVSTTTPYLWRR
ncbi:MAG: GNAT family N-acetyltransferase [Nakamurella sp.]